MLKRLHLQNFRRHEDTEIIFDDTDHLIAIAGANGVGKSSIVEAITFALLGEGRTTSTGKRANIDALVRRGAEVEGMTVDCEFHVDGITYRVQRRRRGRVSSARLFANEVPIVESPSAVTAEIARILGMDAAGFRLAVVAEQKELDGLASLRPAERAKMLSRLMRLDALANARQKARELHNSERKVVEAIGSVQDTAALKADVEAAEAELEAAKAALTDAEAELAVLDRQLAEGADIEARYHQAHTTHVSAQARLDAALDEVTRIKAALDGVVIPDAPAATRDVTDVLKDQADLSRQIAEAEAAKQRAETQKVIEDDHRRVVEQVETLQALIDEHGPSVDIFAAVDNDRTEASALQADIDRLMSERREAEATKNQAQATIAELRRRLDGFDTLSGTCDRCGQEVDAEHLAREVQDLHARIEQENVRAADADELIVATSRAIRECTDALGDVNQRAARTASLAETVKAAEEQIPELVRRRRTYEAQLARAALAVDVDVDALYERKTRLAIEEAEARAVQTRLAEIAAATDRKDRLSSELALAQERAEAAAQERDSTVVPADLADAYAKHRALVESRAGEAELVASCRTEVVRCQERVRSAQQALEGAARLEAQRAARSHKAMVASEAARLIDSVHAELSTAMRPDLEGAVSEVLATMSEGRFPSVKITDDYDVLVHDDGDWRPLTELSGGEVDLVALAVRLGLSSVVAERAGSAGTGFLILDECFGSQDATRRQSIMAALHSLRTRYGQILLISHVGGLEELADRIIEVSASEDRAETLVEVR